LLPKALLIAIQNGVIIEVTGDNRPKALTNQKSKQIDCHGKTILPGFIDPHCHIYSFAERLVSLRVEPANNIRSIPEMQEKIRRLSKEMRPGTWIRASGYNEFYVDEKRHPTRCDLDEATSLHPIKLSHRTGQAHVLNSLALKLVDIRRETPDPPGGFIDRDPKTGEPTGLLFNMGGFLSKRIPPLDHKQLEKGLGLANRELLSCGITSIEDASSHNNRERWKIFCQWKERELLKPRMSMMMGMEGYSKYPKKDFQIHVDEAQLRIGGVKILLDETTGCLYPDQDELNDLVLKIHRAGRQVAIHAVEERAVDSACTAIERAIEQLPEKEHRHRIEHCSVCSPTMAGRLASCGIMVVTQPPFIFYNGERYLNTVHKNQLANLYPLRTLIKAGVSVVGSSDSPIVPPNPLVGLYAAVSRMSQEGTPVSPEQGIQITDALKMYTMNAARAGFEDHRKGSITPGKLADMVVLSDDPTAVPIHETKDINVEMTIIGGEVVWEKGPIL